MNNNVHDVRFCTTKSARPTGAVIFSGLDMMISGQKKSSHAPWKVKIAFAARAGPHSGSTTERKMRNSPAPSMRAASSKLVRDREHVLAEQEDAERRHDPRHDQAPVGVEPAVPAVPRPVVAAEEGDVLDDEVVRDEGDLPGDHHGRQEEDEDPVPSGEAALGEAVGAQRVEERLQHGDRDRDDGAVDEPPPVAVPLGLLGLGELADVQKALVPLQRRVLRDPVRRAGEDLPIGWNEALTSQANGARNRMASGASTR